MNARSWTKILGLLALVVTIGCQGDPNGPVGPPVGAGPSFAKGGVPGPPNGGEEVTGNNLSYPVIFAEGIGLKGLRVTVDGEPSYPNTGLRPSEPVALAELVVDGLPFFFSGNVADYDVYYMQQGDNVWQAEWLDGSLGASRTSLGDWGDNLTHQTWSVNSVIRVEHALYDASANLTGFNMTYLYGTGQNEMQGTDGTTASFQPTIYSAVPRLIIQKLDGEGGDPVQTVFDGTIAEAYGNDGPGYYSAEVNVAGKVIYGFNLFMKRIQMDPGVPKDGWWRITFELLPEAATPVGTVARNVTLTGLLDLTAGEELLYTPQYDAHSTWLDIEIVGRGGGGGGGGGGPGGGPGGPGKGKT